MTPNRTATFVSLASFAIFSSTGLMHAQAPAKPKLSAPAIQIAMVEAGDVQIPPEFRYAVYEQLVEHVRASGAFEKVYRSGDHAADGVAGLITLHTTVNGFKAGSQTMREVAPVMGVTKYGPTRVDITATVTDREGHPLMDQKITGRVRFFGENLNVTIDLAKRITKLVRQSFQTAS